jgi:hypothetical protein
MTFDKDGNPILLWPWGLCQECGKIVRLNKPFIGSLHFCEKGENLASIEHRAGVDPS